MGVSIKELIDFDDRIFSSQDSAKRQQITIVYTKPDYYEDIPHPGGGLIMQHPAFKPKQKNGLGLSYKSFYLSSELIQQFGNLSEPKKVIRLDDYHDPIADIEETYAGQWIASCKLVSLPEQGNRSDTCIDTGWVVILQRRPPVKSNSLSNN